MDDEWHVGEAVFGSHSGRKAKEPTQIGEIQPSDDATVAVDPDEARIGTAPSLGQTTNHETALDGIIPWKPT